MHYIFQYLQKNYCLSDNSNDILINLKGLFKKIIITFIVIFRDVVFNFLLYERTLVHVSRTN